MKMPTGTAGHTMDFARDGQSPRLVRMGGPGCPGPPAPVASPARATPRLWAILLNPPVWPGYSQKIRSGLRSRCARDPPPERLLRLPAAKPAGPAPPPIRPAVSRRALLHAADSGLLDFRST